MHVDDFTAPNITETRRLLLKEDSLSYERGSLRLDEVVICIAILAILTVVALCLFYLCAKKYCCADEDSIDLEPHAIKDALNSSNNNDSIPTIQKAVNGTQSARANKKSSSNNSPAERQTKLLPKRTTSPGHRATSSVGSGFLPPIMKNVVMVHLKRISSAKRSRRFVNPRLAKSNISLSSQRQGKSNVSISGQGVGKSNVSISSQKGSGETRDRKSPVSTQQQFQPQNHVVPITQKEQILTQAEVLQDVPITADIISRNLKETQKEFSMFKSPNFFD